MEAGSPITGSILTNGIITAYVKTGENWEVWPANLYGQVNPQLTDGTTEDKVKTAGYFSFLTPPGQYKLIALAPGFQPFESEVLTVINRPVHLDIGLFPIKGGATIAVQPADLSASRLEVDKTQASLDSLLTYDLYLENNGQLATGNLALTSTIPAHTTYVASSLNCDYGIAVYNSANSQVEWTGKLPVGQKVHIQYKVKVGLGTENVFTVTSQATLSGAAEDLQGVGVFKANTQVQIYQLFLPFLKK